jgi:hypothetical protein
LILLTDLFSRDLTTNQWTGEIPFSIGNLSNLKNCKFRILLEMSSDLFSFISRYLAENQLTAEIPFAIGNLINLQVL